MKNYLVLTIVAVAVVFASCSDSQQLITTSETFGKISSVQTSMYAYLLNPGNEMDSVGLKHNLVFGDVVSNINTIMVYNFGIKNEPLSRINLKNFLVTTVKNNYSVGFDTATIRSYVNAGVNFYVAADYKITERETTTEFINMALSGSSYSNDFKAYFAEFIDSLSYLSTAFQVKGLANRFEAIVISDVSLPSTEKKCLLSVISTAKFSAAFWETEVLGTLVTGIMWGKNNNIAKMKYEKQVGVCAATDACGAYFGFLGGCLGGPAGMALGAFCGGVGGSASYLISLI